MKTLLIACAAALLGFSAVSRAEDAAPKPYPLKICVVSDEPLGAMGKPFVMVYEGQEVKFCCKQCKKDFDKNPAKYLKKIQEGATDKN